MYNNIDNFDKKKKDRQVAIDCALVVKLITLVDMLNLNLMIYYFIQK